MTFGCFPEKGVLLAPLAHLSSADLQAFQTLLAPLRAHAPRTGHGTHLELPRKNKMSPVETYFFLL